MTGEKVPWQDGLAWEGEAISSTELRCRLTAEIESHVDQHALEITQAVEKSEREIFERLSGYTSDQLVEMVDAYDDDEDEDEENDDEDDEEEEES